VYKSGNIKTSHYRNIAAYLPENSLLLFNNTKVVEARILFTKPSGGQIELFCLEPDNRYADITSAMLQSEKVYWTCLIGGASKWKTGQVLTKEFEGGTLEARYLAKNSDSFSIEFSWQPAQLSFAEVLHLSGLIPLPPYIKRKPETDDLSRYQTIYALHNGSVAAPTAGLHFTEAIFEDLANKNIYPAYLTLHVGAGTFRPVKSNRMEEHEMHAEFLDVSIDLLIRLKNNLNKSITAVGTTSLRTLESLYWIALAMKQEGIIPNAQFELDQWYAWEHMEATLSIEEALQCLLDYMESSGIDRLITRTRLLIMPGYRFRIVDQLVTNFHQPQSTLLLLVAAFVGPDWRRIYQHALEHEFRFLSYGDGCLLFRS
jgi:S-adenosylmethionine:tRNA ribosyltransferase-isomerase